MDYTITPQYHEKKDCYIYVVRLTDRVGKDDFTSLSELAKSHKGYYSSFRGVNGFVFKTEVQAEQFCEDMMRVLETNNIPSATSLSSAPTSDEYSVSSIFPSSGMELHKALRSVIQSEGDAIITEVRLVNILDDLKAYSVMPAAKYILRALIVDGITQQLLSGKNWDGIQSKFKSTTGFIPEMVSYIFQSISYGLSNTEVVPALTSNKENVSNEINLNQKSPKRSHKEEHLKFKDTDITGTPNSFAKKLIKKGFEEDVWCDDFFTMKGPFAGVSDCKLWIHFNNVENVVYRVKVEFPWYQNRKRVANDYKKLKKSLQDIYGKPVCDSEDNTQDWTSKYLIPQGIIVLTCFPGNCPQVTIDYYDGFYDTHHGEIYDDVAKLDL